MNVLIIRHAEAFSIGERDIQTDFDRMLTDKGRTDAARIGTMLARLDMELDTLYTSPLVRARETTDLIASNLKRKPEIETLAALSPPGKAGRILRLLRQQQKRTVAFVGHEPFLGEMLQVLLSGTDEPPVPLSKASVACLRVRFQPDETKLRWLLNVNLMKTLLK